MPGSKYYFVVYKEWTRSTKGSKLVDRNAVIKDVLPELWTIGHDNVILQNYWETVKEVYDAYVEKQNAWKKNAA